MGVTTDAHAEVGQSLLRILKNTMAESLSISASRHVTEIITAVRQKQWVVDIDGRSRPSNIAIQNCAIYFQGVWPNNSARLPVHGGGAAPAGPALRRVLGKTVVMVQSCHSNDVGFFSLLLDCAFGGFPLHLPIRL